MGLLAALLLSGATAAEPILCARSSGNTADAALHACIVSALETAKKCARPCRRHRPRFRRDACEAPCRLAYAREVSKCFEEAG